MSTLRHDQELAQRLTALHEHVNTQVDAHYADMQKHIDSTDEGEGSQDAT